MGRELVVRIARIDSNGNKTYRDYQIPALDGEMNVLNALEYIHNYLDPWIAYRSSCRRGVCGACLMMIDGKRRLACETEVRDGMEIDPLSERWSNA